MLDYRNALFRKLDSVTPGNADITFITPKNTVRKVLYGRMALTTDATVANRYITGYIYDDQGQNVWNFKYSVAVTASLTSTDYIGPGTVLNVINNAMQDTVILPPDFTLRFAVANGVAGDTLTVKLIVADFTLTAKDDKTASRRRT